MSVNKTIQQVFEADEGILRLAPNWVPRSFLVPGRRLRLAPSDYYALGVDRGGIGERWFSSIGETSNEGRAPDEGLSYVVSNGQKFTLRDAVQAEGPRLVGKKIWDEYHRWPVFAKFFDFVGPIHHHLHLNDAQAKLVGQEGCTEAYYFPPQYNPTENNFPHTYFGLDPGTTKAQVRRCIERWNEGDNGILELARAYRLKVGTGWFLPPCILHAPGTYCTFETRWVSEAFAMFQSMVDGRPTPWNLLVKDVPKDKRNDFDYIVDILDWEANTDPCFKDHHYLEPIPVADTAAEGYVDKYVSYGKIGGRQLFTTKELTVQPGAKCHLKEGGAHGLLVTQGHGRIGKLSLTCPTMVRFGELTEDEVFVSYEAAVAGITIENLSKVEPLVLLRYYGPDANPGAPEVGDHKKLAK